MSKEIQNSHQWSVKNYKALTEIIQILCSLSLETMNYLSTNMKYIPYVKQNKLIIHHLLLKALIAEMTTAYTEKEETTKRSKIGHPSEKPCI